MTTLTVEDVKQQWVRNGKIKGVPTSEIFCFNRTETMGDGTPLALLCMRGDFYCPFVPTHGLPCGPCGLNSKDPFNHCKEWC